MKILPWSYAIALLPCCLANYQSSLSYMVGMSNLLWLLVSFFGITVLGQSTVWTYSLSASIYPISNTNARLWSGKTKDLKSSIDQYMQSIWLSFSLSYLSKCCISFNTFLSPTPTPHGAVSTNYFWCREALVSIMHFSSSLFNKLSSLELKKIFSLSKYNPSLGVAIILTCISLAWALYSSKKLGHSQPYVGLLIHRRWALLSSLLTVEEELTEDPMLQVMGSLTQLLALWVLLTIPLFRLGCLLNSIRKLL